MMLKVGDAVKWIGFPGASRPAHFSGPRELGIIVDKIETEFFPRYTVLWPDGRIEKEWTEDVEVMNASR